MDNPAQVHAERLAWRQQSWSSIEMRVECRMTVAADWDGPPVDFNAQVERYIETAAGQRLFDSQSLKDGVVKLRGVSYFDGRRGANVIHDEKHPDREQMIMVQRHFGSENSRGPSNRPIPFLYDWVDQIPLHEALATARVLGRSRVLDRDCDVFLFTGRGPHKTLLLVYHLDRATSVPLRVVYHLSEADRLQGRAHYDWTADTLEQGRDYAYVRRGTVLDYSRSKDPAHVYSTNVYEITSLILNRDYPEAIFHPAYHPGAIVFDSTTKKAAYRVPGESNVSVATPSTTGIVSTPPRAEVPRNWAFSIAPVFLGLGACLLLVAVILRRRRSAA